MTGNTSYEPTAEQLAGPARPEDRKYPTLATDVAKGVDLFHDALKREFMKPPFTAPAQRIVDTIDRVALETRGRRA